MNKFARIVILAGVGVAQLAAQQVWKVHNGSLPGAHFTDLPQAVAAAAPNDVILVYHWPAGGTGGSYSATTIDKPLTIIGFAVQVQAPSGSEVLPAWFRGVFTITGITAGQRVLLASCGVYQDLSGTTLVPTGVHVQNCTGEVVLENFRYQSNGAIDSTVSFVNSSNVVLRGCDFLIGGSPIEVINSNVLVTTTSVFHTFPACWPFFCGWPIYTQTTEALRVTSSDVTIINSYLRGANQVGGGFGSNYVARKGVHLVSGSVTVGPGSIVRGGAFASGGGETSSYSIADPLTGTLFQDSRSNIPFPWPAVAPVPTTLHTMLHAWPVAGDVALFDIWGPPGGFALVAFGNRLATPQPTILGDLWFDPSATDVIDIVPLTTPDGSRAWIRNLPLTAPVGFPFVLQALTLDPLGNLSLSVPSSFTVLYPYWIAP